MMRLTHVGYQILITIALLTALVLTGAQATSSEMKLGVHEELNLSEVQSSPLTTPDHASSFIHHYLDDTAQSR